MDGQDKMTPVFVQKRSPPYLACGIDGERFQCRRSCGQEASLLGRKTKVICYHAKIRMKSPVISYRR